MRALLTFIPTFFSLIPTHRNAQETAAMTPDRKVRQRNSTRIRINFSKTTTIRAQLMTLAAKAPPISKARPANASVSGPLAPNAKEVQANREKALAQKSVVTRQISQTTRSLAFGVVASCYALLIANEDLAPLFKTASDWLLVTAVLGIASIILDAAQYVFGYINVERALKSEDQLFPSDWSWQARKWCFVLKQGFAYSSALLLLVVIGSRVG